MNCSFLRISCRKLHNNELKENLLKRSLLEKEASRLTLRLWKRALLSLKEIARGNEQDNLHFSKLEKVR